jgi:hypothetical protein
MPRPSVGNGAVSHRRPRLRENSDLHIVGICGMDQERAEVQDAEMIQVLDGPPLEPV